MSVSDPSFDELVRRADEARRDDRCADALGDLVRALALARASGTRLELIVALRKLGQIERDLDRGERALPLYREAVALCREEGDRLRLAHAVRHLGDLHQDAGRLEEARPHYDEALTIYRQEGGAGTLDVANAVRPAALLEEASGNRERAIELWHDARDLYAQAAVAEGVAECEAAIARIAR